MPASRTIWNADTHRQSGFFDFTSTEAILAGITIAVVQFGYAFAYGLTQTDFAIFQHTTERFVDGLRMYSPEWFDFTPPLFHALILPLAHVDLRTAFVLWTAANVAVAWLVVRIVLRSVPGAWTQTGVIAAWVVNLAGVHMTVRLGQVSWVVALLVTCAWLSARSSRWVAAGVWSGLAIFFKPFLLVIVPVFLVRRRWKALGVLMPTIAACWAVSVLLFGGEAFGDWIANLRAVPDPEYAMHFLNASWVGITARARAPYVFGMWLSAVTLIAMVWRTRTSDEDLTWALLVLASIVASPVGWVYYQPLLVGPGIALAVDGRLTRIRWLAVGAIFPGMGARLFQQQSVLVAVTIGSIYFWTFLVAFVGLAIMRPVKASPCAAQPTRSPDTPDSPGLIGITVEP